MAAFEVLALDTATPQIRAPGSADTYSMPRALAMSVGALTTAVSPMSIAATYNNAGVTFPGALVINVTDTASNAASLLMDWQVGGATRASLRKDGYLVLSLGIGANNYYSSSGGTAASIGTVAGVSNAWSVANALGIGANVALLRDADGVLAQRNSTNAQAFRVYNTWTDASNGEWGAMRWNSNVLEIGAYANGTGTVRNVTLVASTVSILNSAGTVGALVIGLSDGNSGSVTTGIGYDHGVRFGSGGPKRGGIGAAGDGIFMMANGAQTDFGRLQFGGTTSSFPSLKRSTTTLQVRLADDSAYSTIDAQLRAQGTSPASASASGTAGDIRYDSGFIYVCTATNTWVRAALATW
jgi:hypothetical protein